jgi:hypothetical protein
LSFFETWRFKRFEFILECSCQDQYDERTKRWCQRLRESLSEAHAWVWNPRRKPHLFSCRWVVVMGWVERRTQLILATHGGPSFTFLATTARRYSTWISSYSNGFGSRWLQLCQG